LAAQIESRKFDEAEASLEAQQGEDILNADSDGFVSPNVAEGTQLMQDAAAPPDEEMPKRRLRTRFVKRFGGKIVRAREGSCQSWGTGFCQDWRHLSPCRRSEREK
jgi:hypothetical protein